MDGEAAQIVLIVCGFENMFKNKLDQVTELSLISRGDPTNVSESRE